MNLFIQIENGQPINHPAFENNLLQAFGSIPNNWEKFIRVEQPIPGLYEVLEFNKPTYQKVGDVWTDVWSLRSMTEDEIAKQKILEAEFFVENVKPRAPQ